MNGLWTKLAAYPDTGMTVGNNLTPKLGDSPESVGGGLAGDSGGRVVGLEADTPMGAIAKGFVLGLPAAAQLG